MGRHHGKTRGGGGGAAVRLCLGVVAADSTGGVAVVVVVVWRWWVRGEPGGGEGGRKWPGGPRGSRVMTPTLHMERGWTHLSAALRPCGGCWSFGVGVVGVMSWATAPLAGCFVRPRHHQPPSSPPPPTPRQPSTHPRGAPVGHGLPKSHEERTNKKGIPRVGKRSRGRCAQKKKDDARHRHHASRVVGEAPLTPLVGEAHHDHLHRAVAVGGRARGGGWATIHPPIPSPPTTRTPPRHQRARPPPPGPVPTPAPRPPSSPDAPPCPRGIFAPTGGWPIEGAAPAAAARLATQLPAPHPRSIRQVPAIGALRAGSGRAAAVQH